MRGCVTVTVTVTAVTAVTVQLWLWQRLSRLQQMAHGTQSANVIRVFYLISCYVHNRPNRWQSNDPLPTTSRHPTTLWHLSRPTPLPLPLPLSCFSFLILSAAAICLTPHTCTGDFALSLPLSPPLSSPATCCNLKLHLELGFAPTHLLAFLCRNFFHISTNFRQEF